MKVVYISVYRDNTLYAEAATQYILACEAGGIDIVCRPISLCNNLSNKSKCLVGHLENNNLQNINCVIQHILPQHYQYKYGVKNIGFLEWTTSHFNRSTWAENCNLMDEIWVSCEQNKIAAKNSGVHKPIYVISRPCNIYKFAKAYKPLDIDGVNDKTIFYTITDIEKINNVLGLIRTYYRTFTSRDNVVLIIRGQSENKSEQEIVSFLKHASIEIKKNMHLYKDENNYPPILIIAQNLSEEDLNRLHATCDVFISLARGCAWSMAAHDALGFGNPVILNNNGGFVDLVGTNDRKLAWMIPGQMTYCFGVTETPAGLFTGDEEWFDPNLIELSNAMQEAYQLSTVDELKHLKQNAKKRALEFSYEKIGKQIKERL